jgi:glyoxylase-like metal-dependent hydrolase (beta-lactamase superfamily II)
VSTAGVPISTDARPGGRPDTMGGPPSILPGKGYLVEEIRGGLFWVTDGAYNTMFAVSPQGVIVVDPLPSLGPNYLKAIAEVTAEPVTHVVYSHEHTDHIGAATLFPRSATILAHRETATILARRADPRRPGPFVTVDDRYVLQVGDQTLVLDYRGVNHAPGNLFVYAPRQKVLMLADVVYPGYLPYPDLGVAVDIPGYIQAHREALTYEFTEFVGGHVDRLGTRADVEQSLEFVLDLKRAGEEVLAAMPFVTYLRRHHVDLSRTTWFAHDDYEHDRVARSAAILASTWLPRLRGTARLLRTHCRAMIVALAIQFPPSDTSSTTEAPRSIP